MFVCLGLIHWLAYRGPPGVWISEPKLYLNESLGFSKRKSTPGNSILNPKLTSPPLKPFALFPCYRNNASYLWASEISHGIKSEDCAFCAAINSLFQKETEEREPEGTAEEHSDFPRHKIRSKEFLWVCYTHSTEFHKLDAHLGFNVTICCIIH